MNQRGHPKERGVPPRRNTHQTGALPSAEQRLPSPGADFGVNRSPGLASSCRRTFPRLTPQWYPRALVRFTVTGIARKSHPCSHGDGLCPSSCIAAEIHRLFICRVYYRFMRVPRQEWENEKEARFPRLRKDHLLELVNDVIRDGLHAGCVGMYSIFHRVNACVFGNLRAPPDCRGAKEESGVDPERNAAARRGGRL